MAIAYKGFHIYLVDPNTEEQLAFMGDIVVTFTSATSYFTYPSTSNFQNIIDACTSHGVQTNDVLASAGEHPNPAMILYIENLRKVFPATVLIPRNTTYSSCKIKLVNGNGAYLLSTTAIGIGDLTNLNWYIYDRDGNRLTNSSFTWECLNGFSNCTFFGQDGFDGTLKSDKPIWGWKLVTSYGPDYWILDTATAPTTSANDYAKFIDWLNNATPLVPPDPYEPGGYSGPGGGGGTFDGTVDTITIPPAPSFSFADTGFTRIYNPSLQDLKNLANYMWTDTNFLQTLINHAKQLLENPMESIISLSVVPVPVPQGAPETVKVMFIPITGVTMPPATAQFIDVDCGSLFIDEYYGSALDYNPYTQISLFLPFIGHVELNVDEVMNKTLSIVYRVDIVSGLCVAMVSADGTVLYQFSGHCAINMPITSADFSAYIGACIDAVALVAGAIGSAGAGVGAAAEASTAATVQQTGGAAAGAAGAAEATSEALVPVSAGEQALSRVVGGFWSPPEPHVGAIPAMFTEAQKKFIKNSVGIVMSSKIGVQHSGGFSGNSGVLGVRRPYVIITRPRMCNPEEYGTYNGRPCMMYVGLGSCTGYTEVQEIQLTGFNATNPELAEISSLLKGGVIF